MSVLGTPVHANLSNALHDDYVRFSWIFTHFYSVHVTVKLDKQVLSGTTKQHGLHLKYEVF